MLENGNTQIKYVTEGENVIMRACLSNNKTININGYDLELGRFDCEDNETRTINDFAYFIVNKNEMSEISEKLNSVNESKSTKSTRQKKDTTKIEEEY